MPRRIFYLPLTLSLLCGIANSFGIIQRKEGVRLTSSSLLASNNRETSQGNRDDDSDSTSSSSSSPSSKIKGDPLRAASGVRPSLHPLTINAIAQALKVRAENKEDMPLRCCAPEDGESGGVEPLQVALTASKIAADALAVRKKTSVEDGMQFTPEEEQTIAGRVLGVVMRLGNLEQQLLEKCEAVEWISKYHEWDSFGEFPPSSSAAAATASGSSSDDDDSDKRRETMIDQRCLNDPLFGMNRAECLLAIFLQTVEAPEMEKLNTAVPGGSEVDFLDSDRREVLL